MNVTQNINFNRSSFIPADLSDRLTSFSTSGLDAINITAFRDQINQNVVGLDLDMQAEMFRNLSQSFNESANNVALPPEQVSINACTYVVLYMYKSYQIFTLEELFWESV